MPNSKDYILGLFPDNVNNEITASDLRIFVNSIYDEKIDITSIQDNLISTTRDEPLSANQGRILDNKIQDILNKLEDKENLLGVGSYRQILATGSNGNKEWIDLPDIEQVYVYDKLDSVSSTLALSANQGRILNERLGTSNSQINLLNTRVSDLESLTSTNASKILDNTNNISDNSIRINDLVNNTIPNLQNKDTQLENGINTNSVDISNIQSDIGSIQTTIGNHTSKITTLENSNTTLENSINNLGVQVSTNSSDITNINTRLGNVDVILLDSRVTVVEGNYASLDSRITGNTDSISNINSGINNLQTQVNTNTTNISALTGRVTTNENDINTNINSINTINSTISLLSPRVSNNEVDISDLKAQIVRLDSVDSDLRSSINDNRVLIDRNIVDITNNKQDIELIQNEQSEQNTKIQQNYVLTQNNLANVTYLLEQNTSIHQSISSLEMDVNGSPDGTIPGKEENLGAPSKDNMVLASLSDGTRKWVENALTPGLIKDVVDNLNKPTDATEEAYRRESSLSAYQGNILDDKVSSREPSLGNPIIDGMLLSSTAEGTRKWIEANEFKLDYGYYFGAGAQLLRINVIDPVGGIIDNRLENSVRQLQCYATYQVTDKHGNVIENTVDVTNDVDWTSSNTEAYTITDGIGGGLIRCTTQSTTGSSYTDIPVTASLTDNLGNPFTSSINISIDNTPVIKSISVVPDKFSISGISNTYQLSAQATYTHNNWNNSIIDITTSSTWDSNNTNVLTVSSQGLAKAINSGNAIINSSIQRFDSITISGSSLGTVSA